MRHGDYHIARLHPRGHQRKTQSIGAAVYRHGVFGVAKVGEGILESLYHRTTDKSGCPESLLENRQQLCLKFNVRSYQIKKRNCSRIAHLTSTIDSI